MEKWSLMLVVRDKFIVFSYVCVNKIKTWLLNCIRCLKYLCLSLKWTYQGSDRIWSFLIRTLGSLQLVMTNYVLPMLRKCRIECKNMQASQSKWLRILCTELLKVHRIQIRTLFKVYSGMCRPLGEDGDWDHNQVGKGNNKTIKCWYDRYNP